MPNSRSHVLTTYSGRQLDLDEVTADAIFIEDIAGALSKICRFGAQARVFYSVRCAMDTHRGEGAVL